MRILKPGMIGMLLCMSGWLMAQNVVKTSQGARLENSDGACYGEVMFYSPSIVRVVKYAEVGQSASDCQSLSVVMAPQKVKFNLSQKGDEVEIKTSAMLLRVNKMDGTVCFMDRDGRLLLAEKSAPVFNLYKDGADKGDYRIRQTFTLDKDEAIYGLGQLQTGKMSQRDQTKYLIQSNLEDVVTFFQSVKGYGVYWDNYSPTTFTDNTDGTTFDSEVGDFLDYYFMYGFDVKSRKEQNAYLHYTPFMVRRDALNLASKHNSTCILRDKLYFGIFADALGINTAENVVYAVDGALYLLAEKRYITIREFVHGSNTELFCKIVDGECGDGIFILKIQDGRAFYNGSEISCDDLEQRIKGRKYLFQKRLTQHPEMSRLYDRSINSIRLVTVRDLRTQNIVVLPSILRIGANGNVVDNTSQGGIAVGFNLETGQLHQYGFYKPQFGRRVESHPDSKVVFADFYIPFIKEAIEQAKRFHSFLEDIHSIGWDIAISPDGPVFIEGNDNWEINGPQIGNHGLKDEFERYFYISKG